MHIKEFTYYLGYGITSFILGRHKPIVAGIAVTDKCNLQCRHCVVANTGRGHYSYEKITDWARLLYSRGARILYFQGGEPFGWSDKGRKLDDLINAAREIGYFKTAVASNGTYPIETKADAVWISIDGASCNHNKIRGEHIFERMEANLAGSGHPNICINMTINSINCGDVEEVVKFASGHSKIRGISLNFHTPYPGVEKIFLPLEKRRQVVESIIRMKKEGYHILNSISGLKALARGNYKRPLWMIQMVEQDQIFECCWGRQYGEKVCSNCGYGIISEMSQFTKLKPDSILSAFGLFGSRGRLAE